MQKNFPPRPNLAQSTALLSAGSAAVLADFPISRGRRIASGELRHYAALMASTALLSVGAGTAVTLAANNPYDVQSGTVVISGTVVESSEVSKTGAGTLVLTGDVSVESFRVEDGALNLEGNSVSIGNGPFGIYTNDGDAAVNVTDADVTGSGNLFSGLRGGTVTISGGTLSASGSGSGTAAVYSQAGNAVLQGTALSTTGNNAYGVRVDDEGSAIVSDSRIITSGENAFGLVGYQIFNDAPVTMDVSGTSVETSGYKAHGLFAANSSGSSVSDGTPGNINIRFASGSIRTQGVDAAGVYARDSIVSLENASVVADQGNAVAIRNGGIVTASGGELVSGGAAIAVNLAANKDATVTLADGIDATRNDGTLMLITRASGAQGTATLVLDSGAIASGTVADLSDAGGETNLEINDNARFSGNLSGIDQVSLDGGSWSFSGTQGVAALAVGAGGGTLDVSERSTFDTPLTGNGTLAKSGSGTLELTGSSAGFSGLMSIQDGALVVNGTLGGAMLVSSGGRLGGGGTVGSTNVASGGTIAPGNSIGTLYVDGDITFNSGSIYEVELAGNGSSDQIIATGQAFINGGTVELIAIDPQISYQNGKTYVILSAAGGTTGNFDQLVTDSLFLNVSLEDLLNGVGITIGVKESGGTVFTAAASTPNQFATAAALDTLVQSGGSLSLYNSVLSLNTVAAAQSAFEQLSGEIHASAVSGIVEDSRLVRNAANDRLRSAFGTVGGSVTPVLAYGPGGPQLAPPSAESDLVGWATALGSWGTTDSDGNAAEVDRATGGLLVGADTLVGDWRLGLLAGYTHSGFDADDPASSAASDNYHLGLYAGTQWGNIAFRTGAAYTKHDIDSNRSVSIPGLTDNLSAGYNAGTFQAFGELGYEIDLGDTRLEPFVNLAHVRVNTDGFSEDGGAAALSGSAGNTDVTFTTLGLHGEHQVTLGTVDATLRGMVGWRHAFGNTTPQSTHAFAGGDAFTIAGAPIARDSAVLEAGLDLNLSPQATFGVSYTGQIAADAQDHGFKASLGFKF